MRQRLFDHYSLGNMHQLLRQAVSGACQGIVWRLFDYAGEDQYQEVTEQPYNGSIGWTQNSRGVSD